MSNLTILYATDDMTSRLHDAPDAHNWEIFCPTNVSEALAMAVYYAPHAVVIDGDSEWLNELALNLTATTGPSPRMKDIVVRIGGDMLDIDTPSFIDYRELPSDVSPEMLALMLAALDTQRERQGRLDTFVAA